MLERDFLKSHVVDTIDLKFDKEVLYGEKINSCINLVEDDNIKSYHVIKAQDGTVKAVCELGWRKV